MSERTVILLVCTGNLCRSPMAAGLLRDRLAEAGLDGEFEVRSAGTWALDGSPAASYARQVMAERGIAISDHRAHMVTQRDVATAGLILVMEEGHREALLAEFPTGRSKVYLLTEIIGKRYDIADPFGSDIDDYARCATHLANIIDSGFDQVVALARAGFDVEHSADCD
jgi:protein-tyrosine-phosphatase